MMQLLETDNLLSIWQSLKDSVRQNSSRGKEAASGLDYSFITPTLLALGKLQENKVDELIHVLQGSPALIWNLSGKPFSSSIKAKLKSQVLDANWVTPGQFTQAPSLDCIFAQCYSIKSWLDLKNDHVAIVHCANGRSRSGILIACLLKYIGAFDHASHAFDFFCSARMQTETKPSLAPSYRILFENIDKAVDNGGYPNSSPMHLKCLAVSGLPVDEIPCVEVWDMAGQLFSSHVQWKHTNKCTWSADYGDGFFRVAQDLQGDFSVMVRFGGHHALTRDKTTLIFKYQNSIAFLPPEVVELKRQNVDVNPEYSESLDVELFAVHLMFEKATGDSLRTEFRPYRLQGKEAFESGLDEISKMHPVEPDSTKSSALVSMGFPEQYASLALQLANNVLDEASEFIMSMKARSTELTVGVFEMKALPPTPVRSGGGDVVDTVASGLCYSSTSPYSTSAPPEQMGLAPATADSFSPLPQTPNGTGLTSPELGQEMLEAAVKCQVCQEDSILKRDQLILCTNCCNAFHTACVGARRVPFTLKTPRERQNREKYIIKHYGAWRCSACDGGTAPLSLVATGSKTGGSSILGGEEKPGNGHGVPGTRLFGAADSPVPVRSPHVGSMAIDLVRPPHAPPSSSSTPWSPTYSPSGAQGFRQLNSSMTGGTGGGGKSSPGGLSPTPAKTKHDQAAILMGLLASNGITVEELMQMGEDKQREALIAAATMHNKSRTNSESESSSVAVASTGRRSDSPRSTGGTTLSEIRVGSMSSNSPVSIATSGNQTPQGPLDSSSSSTSSTTIIDPTATAAGGAPSQILVGAECQVSQVPELPHTSAASATAPISSPTPTAPEPGPASISPVAALTPAAAAPAATAAGGASISLSTGDAKSALMDMIAKRKPRDDVVTVENPIVANAGPKLQDDPRYAKYIKMVKVGLPKGSVAAKMVMEGVADTAERAMEILCMLPEGPPPSQDSGPVAIGMTKVSDNEVAAGAKPQVTAASTDAPGGLASKVPVGEHPSYSKFFKMLKVGLPKDNVRLKMQQEGKNPDWLDKDPTELVPLDESAPSGGVAVSEHPLYAKYFRMLKVGLPKDAIKAKMVQEGINPAFLDKEPGEMVSTEAEGAKIPVGEHPSYAKFFKMLKVGLPKESIKAKMTQEGLNATFIDKDPTELVLVEENSAAQSAGPSKSGGAAAVVKGPRKKKLHWKGLDASKVGRDSLWADKDDDGMNIMLDEAEFNQLFVESESAKVEKSAEEDKRKDVQQKKMRVNLIDMKRGQNGGIALARIKASFAEVKERIVAMADEGFTTDQLRSLEEFLPTPEEIQLLKSYRGDKELLGQAEKYMLELLALPTASKRIQCMIFKQQFKGRITESKTVITQIENACDDVKMSVRLKKVLKTILKVGNQMNDGADHLGFTLDALLKLQSAKAFDKKTSVLQYVIMLIQRNDENCLLFPEDLGHIAEASRLTMDSVQADHAVLRQGLDRTCRVMAELDGEEAGATGGPMATFLDKARQICDDLDALIESVKTKYSNVLAYFGEDPNLPSSEFFSTLSKFVVEFIKERDVLERQRKAELKRSAGAAGSKDKNLGDGGGVGGGAGLGLGLGLGSSGPGGVAAAGGNSLRRASIQLGSTSQKMAQGLLSSLQKEQHRPGGGDGQTDAAPPSGGGSLSPKQQAASRRASLF